ncbi:MAG: hypothetical protein IKG27_04735 [Bacilli bacterium]|nr:hypothetical protein [Bacilli bacterium]
MNYIYDIYLNFNNSFYDFYEWNKRDKIIHIRKIPTIKVSKKDFYNIKYNKIKISKDFLKTIHNKTEQFNNNKIKYCTIISDEKDIIAIKFDKNGINHMKSSLYIDEKEEIINIIKKQKEYKIKYNILKKFKNNFKTRFEIENEKYILNELNKIYLNKDYQKINYICLECFRKKEKNINEAIKKIKKEITKETDNFYKIFNIFKSINQK